MPNWYLKGIMSKINLLTLLLTQTFCSYISSSVNGSTFFWTQTKTLEVMLHLLRIQVSQQAYLHNTSHLSLHVLLIPLLACHLSQPSSRVETFAKSWPPSSHQCPSSICSLHRKKGNVKTYTRPCHITYLLKDTSVTAHFQNSIQICCHDNKALQG